MRLKKSKFKLGELVIHKVQGYKAVIIDIDPIFQASKHYNPLAIKYDFSCTNIWYRLLVDGCCQETYVKETLLKRTCYPSTINNPKVKDYLIKKDGKYQSNAQKH